MLPDDHYFKIYLELKEASHNTQENQRTRDMMITPNNYVENVHVRGEIQNLQIEQMFGFFLMAVPMYISIAETDWNVIKIERCRYGENG